MTTRVDREFLLEVAKGRISGHSLFHKFGEGTVGTSLVNVWDMPSQAYTYRSTAGPLYLSSSDSSDTSAPIVVVGLDTDGNYQTETKALDAADAQTQVATVKNYARDFRMYHHPAETGNWSHATGLAGDVYGSVTNGDTTNGVPNANADVKMRIMQGEEQTQMALVSVPNGFTGFMLNFYATSESNKVLSSKLHISIFGRNFRTKDIFPAHDPLIEPPILLPPQISSKSDIGILAKVGTGTAAVSAVFDLLLVRNNQVNDLVFV